MWSVMKPTTRKRWSVAKGNTTPGDNTRAYEIIQNPATSTTACNTGNVAVRTDGSDDVDSRDLREHAQHRLTRFIAEHRTVNVVHLSIVTEDMQMLSHD